MNARTPSERVLPDVATGAHAEPAAALARVGMQGIHLPVSLEADPTHLRCGAASVDAWVDLPAGAGRGIHMSRLYAQTEQALAGSALSAAALLDLTAAFLASHADVSGRAGIRVAFDLLIRRPALLSDRSGWKAYPCTLEATLEGDDFRLELGVKVGYSSTCPASAALARQLIQQRFDSDFNTLELSRHAVHDWLGSEQGICATPHGQRSEAAIRVRPAATLGLPFEALIDAVEEALQTPLQTAVKRQDEQAFARLNGENLMFCEDAARRIHAVLSGEQGYRDFIVRCAHFESLHPHDAVAVAVKGVPDGYRA